MTHPIRNLLCRLQGEGDPYHTSRILFIIKCAFAYFISTLVGGAYLARLTSGLGFSDSLTGLLSAFISLSGSFQLISLFLFQKKGSIKWKIILNIQISQILFTFVYLIPLFGLEPGQKRLIFLIGFAAAYILQSIVTPGQTNWMMSLVDEHQRGRFTAANEMFSLLSGMVFTYLMGALIDKFEAAGDTRGAFMVGAVAMAVLTLAHALVIIFIRERKPEKTDSGAQDASAALRQARFSTGQFAFLRNKEMWKVIAAVAIWYVVTYASTPFYGAYQIHELGFSMTFVSVLSILYGIIRSLFSPFVGRYADRHSFKRSFYLCLVIAAVGFLVNCFTVPENGGVFFTVYYCISALAHAGLSSATTNLIFETVPPEDCRNALAVNAAISGLLGFLTTCVMSPVVDMIQRNDNLIFGVRLYAGQFVSIVALVLNIVLFLYVHVVFIRKKTPADAE